MFADATGDRQWIHVDPDRVSVARSHTATLTLSMVTVFMSGIFRIDRPAKSVSIGLNGVRFRRLSRPVAGYAEVPSWSP